MSPRWAHAFPVEMNSFQFFKIKFQSNGTRCSLLVEWGKNFAENTWRIITIEVQFFLFHDSWNVEWNHQVHTRIFFPIFSQHNGTENNLPFVTVRLILSKKKKKKRNWPGGGVKYARELLLSLPSPSANEENDTLSADLSRYLRLKVDYFPAFSFISFADNWTI